MNFAKRLSGVYSRMRSSGHLKSKSILQSEKDYWMMWDGFNRRKFPRLHYPCQVTVHLENQPKVIHTLTENIGAGGICVSLKQEYERFSKCRVQLQLDDSLPAIESMARIVWSVKTKAKKARGVQFDTGIEFVEMNQKSFVLLKKFVEDRIP